MTDSAPLATITSQTESMEMGPDGQIVGGYRVGFRTAKGVAATVFVPKTGYSAQLALAAVKEAATTLDAVQGATVS